MAHKPFCRLNPNYGVDLIKMQQTSMSTGYARRVIREASGPQVSSPPPVILYDRSRVHWYWEESPERMGLHSLVKPPNWVRFDPATEDKLETALESGNAGVRTCVAISRRFSILSPKKYFLKLSGAPSSLIGFRTGHDRAGQVPRRPQEYDAEERKHWLRPAHFPRARLSHRMNSFIPSPASVRNFPEFPTYGSLRGYGR